MSVLKSFPLVELAGASKVTDTPPLVLDELYVPLRLIPAYGDSVRLRTEVLLLFSFDKEEV